MRCDIMEIKSLYEIYLCQPQICTDTRNITEGCLFFCLKGDNFDGNTFARQAMETGAACVVTNDKSLSNDSRFFVVDDTLETLQQLAQYHRKQLSIPIIGITGTNGKTTTKELVSTVLQTKYRITFTQGNLNNHIGVPLTLLSIPADSEIAIVETGANHPGEIADLCRLVLPTYGIITNIGTAHIEGFGSRENIIKTKKAMYDAVMDNGGTLFVNGEDATLCECAGDYDQQILYGNCDQSSCTGHIAAMDPYLSVTCAAPDEEGNSQPVTFRTNLTGDYNLPNILCAIAVGLAFGVSLEEATAAIRDYVPTNHRSQVSTVGTNTVIADYYNANPTSMSAAIRNLAALNAERKAAILGDMLELGVVSREEHLRIYELCKESGIAALFVGRCFKELNINEMVVFQNVEELNGYLLEHPFHDSMILIKGSRGIHLEKVVI